MIRLILAFILATTAVARAQQISQLPAAQVVNTTDMIPCDQVGPSGIVLRRCTVIQLLTNPTIGGSPLSLGVTGADQFTNPLAIDIGGQALAAFGTVSSPGAAASLNVFGSPHGSYAAGCSLCVITTRSAWASSRAAVSGIDYRSGAPAIVGMGFSDFVGTYNYTDNLQALMVLNVASYDATHVYLSTPMTAAQMAQLQSNTYIETNSINTAVPTTPVQVDTALPATAPGQLPPENYYKGIISGWDAGGTYITVAGWAAAISGNTASGQVPPMTPLDTVWSKYATPVVFVGAPTGVTGFNNYIYYDGTRSGGSIGTNAGGGTSLSHWLQSEETDVRYTATVANEVRITGPVLSAFSQGGIGLAGATSDSFVLEIAGDLPQMLQLQAAAGSNQITGTSMFVHGAEGVQTAGGVNRPLTTQFAFTGFVDGVNAINFLEYLKKDSTSATGYTGASIHLGGQIDGKITQPGTGGNFGEVVWNRGAVNVGGVSLCGGSGACGLDVSVAGAVTVNYPLTLVASATLAAGQAISLVDAENDNQHPYLTADALDRIGFHTNLGSEAFADIGARLFRGQVFTVASLPPCNAATAGGRASVSDASGSAFMATLVGGGSTQAPAYCNGTNWLAA